MRSTARFALCFAASFGGYSEAALAQDANKTAIPAATTSAAATQSDETDEALEPIGARIGSFILYPKIEGGLSYNDNIYAIDTKTDDWIARISPSLSLEGDFGTATTAIRAGLDRQEYFNHGTESRTDWNAGANTQVEVSRGSLLYAAGGFSRLHEDRGDPNASYTNRTPTKYDQSEVGGGFSTSATRLRLGLDASYRYYNYYDNVQVGGASVNNDDRDRSVTRVSGRLGYEFSPGYALLGRLNYEKIDYRFDVDDAGFDRNSEGYRATLGVNFELSRVLEGEIWGGYLHRSYDDAQFADYGHGIFGSRLTWYPTQLTKVRFNVDRNVLETVFPGYQGFLSTSFAFGVEHELLRTVNLSVEGRYAADEYIRAIDTTAPQRTDKNYGFNANVKYQLNRNIYTRFAYDWTKRSTNVVLPGLEYNRNQVTATLGLQL